MLLIFTFGYAAWRRLTRNRTSSSLSEPSLPSYLQIGIFILALSILSYLVRFIVPLGEEVSLFVYFFSFPTLAYLPQYLGFFVLGTLASRYDWFRTLPISNGVVGFVTAIVAGVFLFPLAFSGNWFSLEVTEQIVNAYGKGHWRSAIYALWDSTFAVGICLGLIPLFRRLFHGQGRFGRFLSQHSYAVFVFHIPIVVFLAIALQGIVVHPLLKFGVASVIGVPTCFALAYIIRKIPGVSKIL
jgi:hypothetical protein